jgi:hypothetical protein
MYQTWHLGGAPLGRFGFSPGSSLERSFRCFHLIQALGLIACHSSPSNPPLQPPVNECS